VRIASKTLSFIRSQVEAMEVEEAKLWARNTLAPPTPLARGVA